MKSNMLDLSPYLQRKDSMYGVVQMSGDGKAFASRHEALLIAIQAHHVFAPSPLGSIEVLPVTTCHSKHILRSDLPTKQDSFHHLTCHVL